MRLDDDMLIVGVLGGAETEHFCVVSDKGRTCVSKSRQNPSLGEFSSRVSTMTRVHAF